jgi:protein-L-isoaspartate(D-aspartate) O-methyltransferase
MPTSFNTNLIHQRERLVAKIERGGIRNPAVLGALRQVPREAFVPPELREVAYHDVPLPIGREPSRQQLIRVRKISEDDYLQENLGDVRFVPLVGAAGWDGEEHVR